MDYGYRGHSQLEAQDGHYTHLSPCAWVWLTMIFHAFDKRLEETKTSEIDNCMY